MHVKNNVVTSLLKNIDNDTSNLEVIKIMSFLKTTSRQPTGHLLKQHINYLKAMLKYKSKTHESRGIINSNQQK